MPSSRGLRATLLAALAIVAGYGTCGLAVHEAVNRTEEVALAALGFEIFLGTIAFAAAALSPAPLRVRLGLGPSHLSGRLAALLVVGALGLSHALDGLLDLTGLKGQSALATLDAHLAGARGRTLAIAIVGLGIAPGLAEELFCRGLIQRGLTRRLGAPAAIGLAALVFGGLHVDPVHGSSAAVLGLYLGTVAHLAGSVRAAIACHVLNNVAAVCLAAWGTGERLFSIPAIAAGLVAAAGALWVVWRRDGKPPPGGDRGEDIACGTGVEPHPDGRLPGPQRVGEGEPDRAAGGEHGATAPSPQG